MKQKNNASRNGAFFKNTPDACRGYFGSNVTQSFLRAE